MDVSSMKIRDMRTALDERKISAGELADEYISNIKKIRRKAPELYHRYRRACCKTG